VGLIPGVLREAQTFCRVLPERFGRRHPKLDPRSNPNKRWNWALVPPRNSRELRARAPRSHSAMQDAQTYLRFADECMKLARSMPQHRDKLVEMATLWQRLAQDAKKRVVQESEPEHP
jgi:hypothetical protein